MVFWVDCECLTTGKSNLNTYFRTEAFNRTFESHFPKAFYNRNILAIPSRQCAVGLQIEHAEIKVSQNSWANALRAASGPLGMQSAAVLSHRYPFIFRKRVLSQVRFHIHSMSVHLLIIITTHRNSNAGVQPLSSTCFSSSCWNLEDMLVYWSLKLVNMGWMPYLSLFAWKYIPLTFPWIWLKQI